MRPIKKGSTDQSVIVRVVDSADGTPETGVAYNTAGIDLWYRREGGVKVSITEATLAAVDSAHSDGGFIHIGDGYCRLDLPDAAVATGANGVTVGGTITGMVVIGCYVPLVDYDPYDAAGLGLSRIDAAVTTRLAPATPGRTLVVDAAGLADANVVKLGPTGSGTAQTARDIGAGVLVADKTGFSLSTAGVLAIWDQAVSALTTAGAIGKRLVDYLTGDAFTRIGAAGAGLTALGDSRIGNLDAAVSSRASDADMATLLARLTSTRAALLDNLNVGGLVASSAEAASVQNNTRVVRVVPAQIERPDSGSITVPIELLLYDTIGNMEAPDAAPTLVVLASDGTDLSARLDSGTMALVATGRYRAILTVAVGDTLDALRFVFSVVEGGATRVYVNPSWLVDTTAVDFTSTDRSDLQAAKASAAAVEAKLPAGGATIGDATEANVTARATPAQVASALATYDGPTNAEMEARTLAAAAYSTASAVATLQSAIDALNNLSAAQAQSAAAAALAAYDPPTRTEATADKDAVIAAVPTAAQIAAAALAAGDVDGYTLEQTLKLCLAALAGKLSGAATTTIVIRAADDSKARITATVDADGNRSAITLDAVG